MLRPEKQHQLRAEYHTINQQLPGYKALLENFLFRPFIPKRTFPEDFCLLRNQNNLCDFSLEVLERRHSVACKGSVDSLPPPPNPPVPPASPPPSAHLAHGICWKPHQTLASSHCCHEQHFQGSLDR